MGLAYQASGVVIITVVGVALGCWLLRRSSVGIRYLSVQLDFTCGRNGFLLPINDFHFIKNYLKPGSYLGEALPLVFVKLLGRDAAPTGNER